MAVLLIVEMDHTHLKLGSKACFDTLVNLPKTLEKMPVDFIDLFIFNVSGQSLHLQSDIIEKSRTIFVVEKKEGLACTPEIIAPIIAKIAPRYDWVVAGHSHMISPFMVHLAVLMDSVPLLDICTIMAQDRFQYPIYNGLFIKSVKTKTTPKILTLNNIADNQSVVRHTHIALSIQDDAKIQKIERSDIPSLVEVSNKTNSLRTDIDVKNALTEAKIVIGCGGGIEDETQFNKILLLAKRLKAVIGGSKVFIDRGFLTSAELIGQSGKVIAPDIYLALGISGSMHHLSAASEAKIIIAVNKDGEASIIAQSDYNLIGDIATIVPSLIQLLESETS